MDVLEALLTRRTVHAWVPAELPRELLDKALLAAHHAPCHKLTWPWRFRVAGPSARAAVVARGLAMKDPEGTLPEPRRAAIRSKLGDPAALVLLTQVSAPDADPFRRQEDYAACAAAAQNLQLALWGEGWGTKWGTGGLTRDPELLAELGIDPQAEAMVGFLWIGKPARVPEQPRPELAEFVTELL